MSIQDNKNIIRRCQEIYNSNDLDVLGEVVTEDDKVAARLTMTGTHIGEFRSIPARATGWSSPGCTSCSSQRAKSWDTGERRMV